MMSMTIEIIIPNNYLITEKKKRTMTQIETKKPKTKKLKAPNRMKIIPWLIRLTYIFLFFHAKQVEAM